MFNIGIIYLVGGCDFHKDFLQISAYWVKKSAKAGYRDAMIHLGKLYYSGKGVEKNYKLARGWFLKSDTKREASPEVHFLVGKMMIKGEGGSKDFCRGIRRIERSASGGLSCAQLCITRMTETLD